MFVFLFGKNIINVESFKKFNLMISIENFKSLKKVWVAEMPQRRWNMQVQRGMEGWRPPLTFLSR